MGRLASCELHRGFWHLVERCFFNYSRLMTLACVVCFSWGQDVAWGSVCTPGGGHGLQNR